MKLVRQRQNWDCSVACLATIAGLSWEAVEAEALGAIDASYRKGWRKGKRWGLYNREVVALAQRLGISLRPTFPTRRQRPHLDQATGILRVSWSKRTARARARENPGGHFVVLYRGRIIDPDLGCDLPWREYAAECRALIGTLLQVC